LINKYCYDADSINPRTYFIKGYDLRIDSSKRDSFIFVRLKHKGETIKDYRIKFLENWGWRNRSVGLATRKNITQMLSIPVDSILRISLYSGSIPYDELLVPYTDFYHMEISFDFPFYRESDPIVFNCCDKGKDSSKAKEVVCPHNKKRRKHKVNNKPNCIECKMAYKIFE
ncbi:MAG: hypothetical protein ACK43K_03905, partial [Chitinophagales bacterium]